MDSQRPPEPLKDRLATIVQRGHVERMTSDEVAGLVMREWYAETEILHMQLAACMTASIQNTEKSAKDRIGRDNLYWCQAYADVCAAVDREMALRAQVTALRAENESLKRAYVRPDDLRAQLENKDARIAELLRIMEDVRSLCPADPDINPEWHRAWDALVAALFEPRK